MDLSLNARRHPEVTTVEVGGEVDPCTGRLLLDYAQSVMRERGPRLLVDLSGVTFMDSAGVEVLLAIRHRAHLMGGWFGLCSVPAQVIRLLRICDLDDQIVVDEPLVSHRSGS